MSEADNQKSKASVKTPPWDTLLVNINVATMADAQSYGIIENGAIGMKAGRIIGLGAMNELPDIPDKLAVDVIDCGNIWATPGLIDCYSHVVSVTATTNEQSLALSIRWLGDLLKEGVTTVASLVTADLTTDEKVAIAQLARRLEDNYPLYVYTDILDTQLLLLPDAAEKDIKEMVAARKVGVLLPARYYTNKALPLPPLAHLREHKAAFAIASGCDPLSSPPSSLLPLLNMGCQLLGLTAVEALHGLTSLAARAIGIADDIGTISYGKVADIALWDIDHPADLSSHLGGNPCLGVFKAGTLYKVKD